jgi:histidinol-phosphate aminotransferase
MIDLITRVFFECGDKFLIANPDFFLFESYSKRMGATSISIELKEENNFMWVDDNYKQFSDLLSKYKPKVVLLSNPNNPTGQIISEEKLIEMIELACSNNAIIVIDEAYHEFIDDPNDSIAKYIDKYENLIVLRSFSKAIGLAGIRLGYLMCSNQEVINALLLYRHYFPITQQSLDIAKIALDDKNFLYETQQNTIDRRNSLFNNLDTLSSFKYIPSLTNIFMLKNKFLSANELNKIFKEHGIIASSVNILENGENNYMRITIRTNNDNEYLFDICNKIEKKVLSL